MNPADNIGEAIAIVGMSCRFPGASNPAALWELVCRREESVANYPGGRTPELDAFYARAGLPDGPPSRRGGFLPGIDRLDAAFFEISPREAEWIDPQQRLLLELGWEAFEDAGIPAGSVETSGVFIGVWVNEYERHATEHAPVVEFFNVTGGPLYGASSRLAYQFNMRGPDVSVNAACGSSLLAVHLAVRSLRAGECSLALAGGANVLVRPEITQGYSRAGMLSPDGRCKFGDSSADGFVRSDGAGILVLKRLCDAVRDGDRILALIRGTAVTNNGRSSGFLATPGSAGQQRAMREALADAGLDGSTIDYVEAHGTGTRAGDPVEIAAMGAVLGQAPGRSGRCRTASLKSNIGHTESAAGVAGIIRTVQALRHRRFPASLHVSELNPKIDWDGAGIHLETEGAEWIRPEHHPRRGSVNGLGLTGTNAHVILEEAPEVQPARASELLVYLLPISAASAPALRRRAGDTARAVRGMLETGSDALVDLCHTAAVRRTHLAERIAVAATNPEDLCKRLESFARGEEAPFLTAGAATQRRIAFVFPGQGSQWVGMGRELLRTSDTFHRALHAVDAAIQQEAGWSVIRQLEDPALDERLSRIDVVQPTLFAMEVALAELWESWGVHPDAVVGHSMGEIAAACSGGILSREDAARIICRRSALLTRVAGSGAMVVVELNEEDARRAIAGAEEKVSVAVCNSPRSTVLAGDPAALDIIVAELERQDVFCRWVRVDVASHSPHMDILKADLAQAVAGVQPRAGSVPFCSTVRAGVLEGCQLGGSYWVENLRQPVLFSNAVRKLLVEGINTFIEMSPHPILVPFVEQTADDAGVVAVGSLRREEPETVALMDSLGRLYTAGVDPDWRALYPSGNLVDLPAYPWQRERFWMEGAAHPRRTGGHPLLGEALDTGSGVRVWTAILSLETHPWLRDHAVAGTILLPASAYAEMSAACGKALFDADPLTEGLTLREPLVLSPGQSFEFQAMATPESAGNFRLRFFARETAAESWTELAECLLRRNEIEVGDSVDRAAWENAEFTPTTLVGSEHARRLAQVGYEFGPAFCRVEWMHAEGCSALAQIRADETNSAWRVHPATLDAGLQVLAALLLDRDRLHQPILPVRIERIVWGSPSAGGALLVRATADSGRLGGRVEYCDTAGRILVTLEGVTFRALEGEARTTQALYSFGWEKLAVTREGVAEPGPWLLIGDQTETALLLADALRGRGASVLLATAAEALSGVATADVQVLWLTPLGLTPDASVRDVEEVLGKGATLIAHLAESRPERVWVVTRATQTTDNETTVHVVGAGVWGFFASVANEFPTSRATCVDLPARPLQDELNTLAAILVQGPAEARIAVRADGCFAARLVEFEPSQDATVAPSALRADQNFALVQGTRGSLVSLELRTLPADAPGPDEVEICVEAAGLNFRDVMRAMGMIEALASPYFGGECAGTVTRVGSSVHNLRPGDAVLSISPSFGDRGMVASRANVPESLARKKPENMTFAQAAGIPCVFLTAWYGLVKLARLRPGERVLIHAGAGGVGMAAIQVARWIGAEIFATAGSAEKRDVLRQLGVSRVMNSRTLDFSREVLESTGGRGVDVLLNSLAGPAIDAGLQALAPYGRFIEIGNRDIGENRRMGLEPFRRNLSFFAVDLAQAVQDRREMVADLFSEVMDRFAAGDFVPLRTTLWPISSANEAFGSMARGAHIGKVVLDLKDANARVHLDASHLRPDATYLVTGGLGGVGLELAEALVENGARHLVLTSRRAPSATAQRKIAALEQQGVQIDVQLADVGDPDAVAALLAGIRRSTWPLRGILHAAGILEDSVVAHLSREKIERVLAGKAGGALALDANLEAGELDFLVYTSSVAGVLGIPGQANYAAANAILDALAHRQRLRGIPAVSIDWGTWSEVGLAAAAENRGARMEGQGITALRPATGRDLLIAILSRMPTQVAAMNFDAKRWCAAHPAAADSGFLSKLRDGETNSTLAGDDGAADFRSLHGEDLRSRLADWIRRQVASILRLELERVPEDKPLRSLGLDSLMALELRNRLERQLKLRLSATLVWNYPTVAALAGHLRPRLESSRPHEVRAEAHHDQESTPATTTHTEGGESPSVAQMLEAELLEVEGLLNQSFSLTLEGTRRVE